VTNAKFETEIGDFDTDINLKLGPHQVKTILFRQAATKISTLGYFLRIQLYFKNWISMAASMEAAFRRQDAMFDLVSDISALASMATTIKISRQMQYLLSSFLMETWSIDDPNLQFNGNMSIDLKQENEIIQVKAELGKAVLDTLRLLKNPHISAPRSTWICMG
jgi:hypothetical protein